MLAVSFAWIAVVELTPASQRPYVGSSTNNTELGLTFEYNGVGRVEGVEMPPAELAIIVHHGPHDDIDRAYGALGTHVTQHALAVEGPIREYYLCGRHDTPDESAWRTEIGWPIFQTSTR